MRTKFQRKSKMLTLFARHISTNKCPLSKKRDHRCLTSLPKVQALCILAVQKGANTCIQETVKEPLNGQLFIHKCDMGCPFRNCLTSCSRSDVKKQQCAVLVQISALKLRKQPMCCCLISNSSLPTQQIQLFVQTYQKFKLHAGIH